VDENLKQYFTSLDLYKIIEGQKKLNYKIENMQAKITMDEFKLLESRWEKIKKDVTKS